MRTPSRASVAIRAIASAVVAFAVWVPATTSDAREDELLELAQLLPDPSRIHPDIAAQVSVDLSGIGPVAERLSAARADLIDATGRLDGADARIGSLQFDLTLVRRDLLDWRSEEAAAEALLEEAATDLGQFAVGTFVGFEEVDLGALRLEGDVDPAATLADTVGGVLTENRDAAAERHETAIAMIGDLEQRVGDIETEIEDLIDTKATAAVDIEAAQARVDEYEPAFELALLGAPVRGADFPVVVLDAYYRAQLTVAEERPGCEVRWDHLAGIGRVESRHGAYGGNTVAADGRTSGEILGPVLDGDPWQAIADTDGGLHDGDPVWDRAVGPMQFIPGSWARYGRDGNGDGEVDPHNIFDAALAAAGHLCGTTGGLSTPGNFQRALLGYNRSVSYGVSVMGFADGYLDEIGLVATEGSVA